MTFAEIRNAPQPMKSEKMQNARFDKLKAAMACESHAP
jgi:hypothetical protein